MIALRIQNTSAESGPLSGPSIVLETPSRTYQFVSDTVEEVFI